MLTGQKCSEECCNAKQDLIQILRIGACETFHTSINRPNLCYSVRDKPTNASEAMADIMAWIQQHSAGETHPV